jgi:transposase
MENNRSLKMMERINQVIDWSNIEAVLMQHYDIGTKKEGADAYPISFKKFLGLSFNKPSPDHSTFSRFRARLKKETLTNMAGPQAL